MNTSTILRHLAHREVLLVVLVACRLNSPASEVVYIYICLFILVRFITSQCIFDVDHCFCLYFCILKTFCCFCVVFVTVGVDIDLTWCSVSRYLFHAVIVTSIKWWWWELWMALKWVVNVVGDTDLQSLLSNMNQQQLMQLLGNVTRLIVSLKFLLATFFHLRDAESNASSYYQ